MVQVEAIIIITNHEVEARHQGEGQEPQTPWEHRAGGRNKIQNKNKIESEEIVSGYLIEAAGLVHGSLQNNTKLRLTLLYFNTKHPI